MSTRSFNALFLGPVQWRAALAMVCAALFWSAGAPAADDGSSLADLSIEELLELRVASGYGESKREQKVTQAPAPVATVAADAIRHSQNRPMLPGKVTCKF